MITLGFDALFAVFLATIVLVIKPGPYVIAVTGLAVSGSWRKCASFLLGGYLGATFFYLLLLTGLSYIKQFDLGFVFFLLKSLGAAWFIWLGIKGLMHSHINAEEAEAKQASIKEKSDLEDFIAGFILSNTNPYIILFVTGVIPAIVKQDVFTVPDILAIRVAVILADILTLLVYIVPAMTLRQFLTGKVLAKLNIAASAVMILIGLYIGYTAIMADDLLTSGLLS